MELSGDFYKNVRGKFLSGIIKALFDGGMSWAVRNVCILFGIC